MPEDQVLTGSVYAEVAFAATSAGLGPAEVAERVARCLEDVGLRVAVDTDPRRLSGGQAVVFPDRVGRRCVITR